MTETRERLDDHDRATQRALAQSKTIVLANEQFFLAQITDRYGLKEGDQVDEDGYLVRKSTVSGTAPNGKAPGEILDLKDMASKAVARALEDVQDERRAEAGEIIHRVKPPKLRVKK